MHTAHTILECRELARELPFPPRRKLIENVTFALGLAEVLAIVGPSGAGKSTLLRLLNRLDEPTHGSICLRGRDFREIPVHELRRSVGMVMQRAYLFPGTVAENIGFGPLQRGLALDGATIEDMLARVGLDDYAGRDVSTLSGGEAQRVAIMRALANEPDVLLLDEPTSALDEVARDGVENLLSSLIRERHLACVWVTHSVEQARTMADRVLVMRSGRVEAIGPPAEVLRA